MSEITQTKQSICVGRLILEIPSVVKIIKWRYEVDDIKINPIKPPSLNQKVFDAKVNQLESKYKNSPHITEGVRLKNKIQLSPTSVLFVFREDERDTTGYGFEALSWQPYVEYKFEKNTTNKHLDNVKMRISKLTKSFVATPNINPINAQPGFCLENGVLTDTDLEFRGEDITIQGGIEAYPDLEFKFTAISTNKKNEDPTLLERNARSFGLGDAIGIAISNSTKFLRKGKRTLNGQSGEELVLIGKLDGITSMHGSAEFYGEPNILEKPAIEVSLSYDPSVENTQQTNKKTLTEKEFLALWDSLINGIRPRANSLWGDAGKK